MARKKPLIPDVIEYTANPYGNQIIMFRDRRMLEKHYHKLTGSNEKIKECADGITIHLESKEEAAVFLIGWFEPHKVSTLAHECSHTAFRLCHEVGIDLEYDNNEAHAYLLSDMMDVFLGVRR